ncbi:hypothetical protein [Alteromonas sp. CYL-A6]|uniref:hypothetical protein n=1 Tax=Alteromonas nitratireducens TaxID=3390813 RepID=UPI0034A7288D
MIKSASHWMKLTTAIVLWTMLSGCVSSVAENLPALTERQRVTLPPSLSETSGLFCQGERLLTINDSGNSPLLYTINTRGDVEHVRLLHARNHDWEAVTMIGDTAFVADIGNNHGNRENLSVIQVSASKEETVYPVGYADNTPARNTSYAHDFDAEALTAKEGKLLLFSKSWASYDARVYIFAPGEDISQLRPSARITGLPGVITGADWDSVRNEFAVIGYRSDPFGNFDAFLARISEDFRVITVWPLDGFRQAEGICVSPSGSYWVSQEADDTQPALLIELVPDI